MRPLLISQTVPSYKILLIDNFILFPGQGQLQSAGWCHLNIPRWYLFLRKVHLDLDWCCCNEYYSNSLDLFCQIVDVTLVSTTDTRIIGINPIPVEWVSIWYPPLTAVSTIMTKKTWDYEQPAYKPVSRFFPSIVCLRPGLLWFCWQVTEIGLSKQKYKLVDH